HDFAAPLQKTISRQGKKQKRRYPKTDQFGAELVYFSNCILNDTEVEPSGIEGWKDVRIIEALIEANSRGERIQLRLDESGPRPGLRQKIVRPAIRPPSLVNVSPPSS